MTSERLYRENITLFLAEPEAFADRTAPTAEELNNSTLVHNITCALWEDDTEFTLGDPETDDGLTFCDEAGTSNPTFDNPTVVYSALRDADRTATGVFAAAFKLLAWPDRQYIAGLRVGHDSDVAFAAGHKVSLVAVKTNVPIDVMANGENARIRNDLLNNGFVNWNYTLAA